MKNKLTSLVVTIMIIITNIVVGTKMISANAQTITSKRLSGSERIETSLAIANDYNSGILENVVLATAYDFPDALTGSVLGAKLKAPILLAGKEPKDCQKTLDYVKAHLSKSGGIYILGGNGVIGDSIITYLKSKGFNNFVRLGGSTRHETAKLIDESIGVKVGTPVFIAIDDNFPDALSVSSVAGIKQYPILLTLKNSLPQATIDLLNTIKPSKVYIVGGTGVITEDVRSQIKTQLGLQDSSIVRLSGSDRYDTSLAVAKEFNLSTSNAVIATGEDFPDALSGSVLAVKYNAPIVLVSNDIPKQKDYLYSQGINNILILGGNGVVSLATEDILKDNNPSLGNIQANIVNGGSAVRQGDWIYYAGADYAIYKIKSDGSYKTRLVTANALDLNIKGDWLYYIADDHISKIKTDGTNNQRISDRKVVNKMIIVGDIIYVEEEYGGGMTLLTLDGSCIGVQWGNGRDFIVSGENFYFNNMGDFEDYIYVSGPETKQLNNEHSYNLNLYDDRIYFTNSDHYIIRINTDGSNRTQIGTDKAENLLVTEGWIYYSNKSDNYKLYKMKLDGSSKTKISDKTIEAFNIVGDLVKFNENGETKFIKK
ncbi:cell wall-binding repeat-containing protein [Clostridium sp. YIM B02551]|uniref:cell wall-binding repeat-containing protein n=1 Tax=Clostridium sp. YIM B02551 TaxID=2910679 RepID=UPI001EECDA12|nr:cell wall-binding repeat-containing protein [Clostridium sp. YIM B02551]